MITPRCLLYCPKPDTRTVSFFLAEATDGRKPKGRVRGFQASRNHSSESVYTKSSGFSETV